MQELEIDTDTILTKSELRLLGEYRKDKAAGKLIKLENVKKELEERGVYVRRRAV